MRLICLLFLLISLLESAPSTSECKYESFKAKTCLKFITADVEKIGPKEEFDAKKSKFQDFFTCLGEPKCEHSRMLLKIEKTYMDIMERFSEIHSCLGNNDFFNSMEYRLSEVATKKGCKTFQKFVLQRIDVTRKIKDFLKFVELVYVYMSNYKEKLLNREDPKFAECMIEKVGKEEKCSSADLEKFKESMKLMPGMFRMMSDYKEKRDEIEKMSDKKNDN
ncbi:hypothetical protein L5515_010405 [Caenorhabditis briggsae]|uniref:Uncharacterized protein n=2 Tax=Caenorhabditis briggsae TaxID=6238 RepID=A0AAE9EUI9_CAEBR|nr:hypothetical protein L5515_010405 [Caenorhabditis briggsae]